MARLRVLQTSHGGVVPADDEVRELCLSLRRDLVRWDGSWMSHGYHGTWVVSRALHGLGISGVGGPGFDSSIATASLRA